MVHHLALRVHYMQHLQRFGLYTGYTAITETASIKVLPWNTFYNTLFVFSDFHSTRQNVLKYTCFILIILRAPKTKFQSLRIYTDEESLRAYSQQVIGCHFPALCAIIN